MTGMVATFYAWCCNCTFCQFYFKRANTFLRASNRIYVQFLLISHYKMIFIEHKISQLFVSCRQYNNNSLVYSNNSVLYMYKKL